MPRGINPAPSTEDAKRRARRAAQRRVALARREGRPALPPQYHQAYERAVLRDQSPEQIERLVGDKPLEGDTFPEASTFRSLHSYSAKTVTYMASVMTPRQRDIAVRVSASEYQGLASRQGAFNVYWYHSNNLDTLRDMYESQH